MFEFPGSDTQYINASDKARYSVFKLFRCLLGGHFTGLTVFESLC